MDDAGIKDTAQPVGVELKNLSKQYASRNGNILALDQVNFSIQPGEFICVVGPSGCGKSTLLKLLADLTPPTSGQIQFSGAKLNGWPRNALVFQEHGLFPWMSLLDNVAFGLEAAQVKVELRRQKANDLLTQFGLAGFGRNYPHELSVGMRQRAAIARALLVNPQLLLMDEPFSALDAQSKLVMQEELLRIWRDRNVTVLYVTHDIEEAVLLGDRVLIMSGRPGRITEDLPVPLGRPRNLRDRNQPEVVEVTWHIWKAIEREVRQSLHVLA
jgi:NitT/TauT family transport system ATP-binding protein